MENFALENSTYIADNISLSSNKNSIKTQTGSQKQLNNIINEYRLTQNNFNPNKKTPPNAFLNKLQQRMNYYYKKNSLITTDSEFTLR